MKYLIIPIVLIFFGCEGMVHYKGQDYHVCMAENQEKIKEIAEECVGHGGAAYGCTLRAEEFVCIYRKTGSDGVIGE